MKITPINNEPEIKDDDFILKDFLMGYLRHWYLFVFFVVVAVAIAYVINFFAVPTYDVSTRILIEESSDQTIYSETIIPDLNYIFRSKTLENEIQVFTSRDLISKTLRELELEVSYVQVGNYKERELYKGVPFEVDYHHLSDACYYTAFEIEIKSEHEFQLSYSKTKRSEEKVVETYNFGDPVTAYDGLFFVEKNDFTDYELYNDTTQIRDFRKFKIYFNFHEDLINAYRGKISAIESDRNADAILLTMNDAIPERGIDFLNTMLQVYVQSAIEEKRDLAWNMYDFIEERMAINFADLDSLEKQIERFKANRSISDINNEANYILEGIKKFEIELSDAESQLHMVDASLLEMESTNQAQISVPTTMLGISDYFLNNLVGNINKKQNELEKIRTTVQPDNPLIIELLTEIGELKKSLYINLVNHKRNIEISVVDIRERIRKYKEELRLLNGNSNDLGGLERRRNIKEQLYIYLLKKKEEAAMALASRVLDSKVIEKPFAGGPIYNPKKSIVLLIGLMLGLIIPVILITVTEILNQRVKRVSHIKKGTDTPVIAEIKMTKHKKLLHKYNHFNSTMAEQFRMFWFNLQHQFKHKVLLVTSSIPGEGKSHTALNLGYTVATLGNKVCVLELEMRRPIMKKELNLDSEKGMADYLEGKCSLKDLLIPSQEHPNLFVIPAGTIIDNPSHALLNPRLNQAFAELRKEFDQIIIDSPPVSIVSDAYILSKFADSTVYLVRDGVTHKSYLKFIDDLNKTERFDNLSILFNAVKTTSSVSNYYTYSPATRRGLIGRIQSFFNRGKASA